MPFRDRIEAGRKLAQQLLRHKGDDVVVLGLPRGGLPVAWEVAQALEAPLDVFVVRKLGVPWNEELAMGAIASGGVRVLLRDIVRQAGVSQADVERIADREHRELQRREQAYRRGGGPIPLEGRTVIVVDDGLATGASMKAALEALALRKVARRICAIPVAPRDTVEDLRPLCDELVVLEMPEPFYAVGYWYSDFGQTTDEEVKEILDRRSGRQPALGR